MRIKVLELAETVATLLGETLALECRPEESPFPGIAERVSILAPSLLTTILSEAPIEKLSGFKSVTSSVNIDSAGCVTIKLPDDFLRLASVKMSDWARPVTEITPPDSKCMPYQYSRWEGVRGNQWKPVATIETESEGKVMKLYSSREGAKLDRFIYLPVPKIDSDGCIDIPDSLLPEITNRLCTIIKS